MKTVYFLILPALAFVLNSCGSEEFPKEISSNQNVSKLTNLDMTFAGAVVFEFGATTATLDTKNLKPLAKVTICIDKSNQLKTGEVKIDFATLGVPAYRKELSDNKTVELTSTVLNYTFKGKIASSVPYAWGDVSFQSSASGLWTQIDNGDISKNYDSTLDIFNLNYTTSTLSASSITYYEIDGKVYYMSNTLQRFHENVETHEISSMADCEQQKASVLVQSTATPAAKKP